MCRILITQVRFQISYQHYYLRYHLRSNPKLLTVVNADKIKLSALILIKQLFDRRISRKQLGLGRGEFFYDLLVFLAAVLVGADGEQVAIVHFFNNIHY